MFNILIVEDQPVNRALTIDLLKEFYDEHIGEIQTAGSVAEAAERLVDFAPQLVLLDIHLPDGEGIELLTRIQLLGAEVIFITAYDQYAIKAFQSAALHYLLKPINISQFKEAMQRFLDKHQPAEEVENNSEIEAFFHFYQSERNRVAIPTKSELIFLPYKELVSLQADGSYTRLNLMEEANLIASKSLGYFQEILPEFPFTRVHDKTIVNVTYVRKYHKGRGGAVEMQNGDRFAVSSRKKNDLLNIMQQYYKLGHLG